MIIDTVYNSTIQLGDIFIKLLGVVKFKEFQHKLNL